MFITKTMNKKYSSNNRCRTVTYKLKLIIVTKMNIIN